MNELWRKPDVVYVNQFDGSMYPFLLQKELSNERKEEIEDMRKHYFERENEDSTHFTDEECNQLREILGPSFVLEAYTKKELREKLKGKKGKHKRQEGLREGDVE